MFNAVICRYHEIATKGDNRNFFERKLLENLRRLLHEELPELQYKRIRGRVWLEFPQRREMTERELEIIRENLAVKGFGLESFSPVIMVKPDMECIRNAVAQAAQQIVPGMIAQAQEKGEKLTFRFRARRSNKDFPLRSQEIEIELATLFGDTYGEDKLKLSLNAAALSIGVEVRDEMALIWLESFVAPGGLPVGCNDRVLALLSGGIDSPVACYLTMKRGSPVDFIGFHSAPYTPEATTDKVSRIAAYLNGFQASGRLYLVNLVELQKLIRDRCNPRFRTVLYRRMMFRIAEAVAQHHKIGALLTGESLGQVASQTLVNMNTIDRSVNMLVLRPLCGQDKNETIRIAAEIGTFELSKEQVPDSCTVFAPGNPSTCVTEAEALAEEAKIPEYESIIADLTRDL